MDQLYKQYEFKIGGNELAKVLLYYGLIVSIESVVQKIICPLHEDINPSMMVDLAKGTWFCFGCNVSGDALRLVELIEQKRGGINFSALKSCNKFIQILHSKFVSKVVFDHILTKPLEADISDYFDRSYDYYYGLSSIDWEAPSEAEAIEAKAYMLQRGFTQEALNGANAKVTYNQQYPIIFPMLDNGEFKGWVCRTTTKEVEQRRKYLYNKGFSRANTLVGDYGDKNYVVVVEGYMDRLKFIQYGYTNVVAILGWKMSQQQIKKLNDAGITHVISALDNDECGKKGTKYLERYFNVVRFRYFKSIKDPGEINSKGAFMRMFRKTLNVLRDSKNG